MNVRSLYDRGDCFSTTLLTSFVCMHANHALDWNERHLMHNLNWNDSILDDAKQFVFKVTHRTAIYGIYVVIPNKRSMTANIDIRRI